MVRKALLLTVFVALLAERSPALEAGALQISPHGYGSLEMGQVVKGTLSDSTDTSMVWQQRARLRMGFEAAYHERLRIAVSIEALMNFAFPQIGGAFNTILPVTFFSIHQADVTRLFGDPDRHWLKIGFGVFPYKYDQDAMNLGEYLFRTGTYPPYIITSFDRPYAELMGGVVSHGFTTESGVVSSFRQDLLLTSEMEVYPTQNLSLSYLPSVRLVNNAVEVGVGAEFANLLSVFGKDYVSPPVANNRYLTNEVRDPVADTVISADTNYYTFQGIKLMARAGFDPKRLWAPNGDFGIFGAEDLRLYVETAILGVKNYPVNADSTAIYTDIRQRWPVMVGFHVPTFKVLDVLALEIEYFGSRIPDDFDAVERQRIPVHKSLLANRDYSADDVKWTVYAQRHIGDVFSVCGVVGSDHLRIPANESANWDREENLRGPDQWYYMLKLKYEF